MNDVRIDREALRAIVAHARRDAPAECCGLLVGTPGHDMAGLHVLEAIPTSNNASDPSREYLIDPADYLSQIRRCRRINGAQATNFGVVGAYHSHPRAGAEPSDTDTVRAFRDFLFVIVGLDGGGTGMAIRAYTLDDDVLVVRALTVVD